MIPTYLHTRICRHNSIQLLYQLNYNIQHSLQHTQLRVICCNINGITDQKLLLHDTVVYLEAFDVVVLVETQVELVEFTSAGLMPGYTHFGITAPQAHMRGYGISVSVRETLASGTSGVSTWATDEDGCCLAALSWCVVWCVFACFLCSLLCAPSGVLQATGTRRCRPLWGYGTAC